MRNRVELILGVGLLMSINHIGTIAFEFRFIDALKTDLILMGMLMFSLYIDKRFTNHDKDVQEKKK